MIRKDSPETVVPSYVGTSRLEESADTWKRSWEHVDSRTYPDSEESEDDVVYDGEGESELQRINLRNELMNQITVDACGELQLVSADRRVVWKVGRPGVRD